MGIYQDIQEHVVIAVKNVKNENVFDEMETILCLKGKNTFFGE
jgi:hypothetical protein